MYVSNSLLFSDCEEVVTWVLGQRRIPIDAETLMNFRMLVDKDGNPLQDNFREIQDLGDRTIYKVEEM